MLRVAQLMLVLALAGTAGLCLRPLVLLAALWGRFLPIPALTLPTVVLAGLSEMEMLHSLHSTLDDDHNGEITPGETTSV